MKSRVATGYGKIAALLLIAGGLLLSSILPVQRSAQAAEIIVYKSPTCGCCKKWVSHLEQHGYTVEVHNQNRNKLSSIRKSKRAGRCRSWSALAQSHVGIAMGTDVAMESAGVTLVKEDLRGIVRARRLSRATMRNIRQNLFFAFIYNSPGVPVAAGVLYPAFGLLLSPIIAAAAMSFSSVSVISKALRLRRVKI